MVRDPSFTQRCDVVNFFLASENMVVGNNPPYSPELSPCSKAQENVSWK